MDENAARFCGEQFSNNTVVSTAVLLVTLCVRWTETRGARIVSEPTKLLPYCCRGGTRGVDSDRPTVQHPRLRCWVFASAWPLLGSTTCVLLQARASNTCPEAHPQALTRRNSTNIFLPRRLRLCRRSASPRSSKSCGEGRQRELARRNIT